MHKHVILVSHREHVVGVEVALVVLTVHPAPLLAGLGGRVGLEDRERGRVVRLGQRGEGVALAGVDVLQPLDAADVDAERDGERVLVLQDPRVDQPRGLEDLHGGAQVRLGRRIREDLDVLALHGPPLRDGGALRLEVGHGAGDLNVEALRETHGRGEIGRRLGDRGRAHRGGGRGGDGRGLANTHSTCIRQLLNTYPC